MPPTNLRNRPDSSECKRFWLAGSAVHSRGVLRYVPVSPSKTSFPPSRPCCCRPAFNSHGRNRSFGLATQHHRKSPRSGHPGVAACAVDGLICLVVLRREVRLPEFVSPHTSGTTGPSETPRMPETFLGANNAKLWNVFPIVHIPNDTRHFPSFGTTAIAAPTVYNLLSTTPRGTIGTANIAPSAQAPGHHPFSG